MRSSINCLLIGLASFDIVLILTSILMFGLPSIYTHSLVTGESRCAAGEETALHVSRNSVSYFLPDLTFDCKLFRLLSLYFHRVFPYITPVVFPVGRVKTL